MIYAIIALSVYFLFSIHRVWKSFFLQSELDRIVRSDSKNRNRVIDLEKALEESKSNCIYYQDRLKVSQAEVKKLLLSPHSSVPPPAPPSPDILAFPERIIELLHENKALTNQLNDYKDLRAQNDHLRIHYKRDETWKELLYRRGKERFNLSQNDIDSINFPVFNPEKVFYANATGQRFHAVRWCYRLDNSVHVDSCTYAEAVMDKRTPCHACIDVRHLPEAKYRHD